MEVDAGASRVTKSKNKQNAAQETDSSVISSSATSLSVSIPASLQTLRLEPIKQEITTYLEHVPEIFAAREANKLVHSYLRSMIEQGPEKAGRALSVVKTVGSICSQYASREKKSKSQSSAILSATGLMKVAVDLDLNSREVKDVAELAISQGRSVARVGKFVKEFAASRTAQDPDLVFKLMPHEKRADVLSDVQQLTKEIRGIENSLPSGERIHLATLDRLLELTGSVDVALNLVSQLTEFPIIDSQFEFMFNPRSGFHNRYDSILRYAIQKMEEGEGDACNFDMESFLSSRDNSSLSAIESLTEDPRDETDPFYELNS